MSVFECMAKLLGVAYIYEKEAVTAEEPARALAPEALSKLPEDLREELRVALTRLDIRQIDQIIVRISAWDTDLGKTLRSYADRYDFTTVLHALEVSPKAR